MKPLANKTLDELKHRCQSQLSYALPLLEKQGKLKNVYIWFDGADHLFSVFSDRGVHIRYDKELEGPAFWNYELRRWDLVLNLNVSDLCSAADWAIASLQF